MSSFVELQDAVFDDVSNRLYVLERRPARLSAFDGEGRPLERRDLPEAIQNPFGLAANGGRLFLGDRSGVWRFNPDLSLDPNSLVLFHYWAVGRGESIQTSNPFNPQHFEALWADADGRFYVLDRVLEAIHQFSPDGRWIAGMGGGGLGGTIGNRKASIVGADYDSARDLWTVILKNSPEIRVATSSGKISGTAVLRDEFAFERTEGIPSAAAGSPDGKIAAFDRYTGDLWVFGLNGFLLYRVPLEMQESGALAEPKRIFFDDRGILYRIDAFEGSIAACRLTPP